MSPEALLLYIGTTLLVVVIPGPTVLCIVTQAGRFGFRRSLVGIAGIQAGHIVLFGFVAAGLATAFATHSGVMDVIRLAGAGYLIYLGLRLVFAPAKTKATSPAPVGRLVVNRNLFLQAFATQISNPKAYFLVSAYVPQFIRPDFPLLSQIVILLVVTVVLEAAVLIGYAYLTIRSLTSFRASPAGQWLEKALGVAFVFFGVRMLLDRK